MIRDNRFLRPMFAAALPLCLAAAFSGAGFGLRVFAGPSQPLTPASPARPANAPSVFSPDKGKFRILINGQQVGSEEFEISASGDTWI